VVNWVTLGTPLGLGLARAGRASVTPGPDGLLLAHGWRFRRPRASAFTVGNVILTRHPPGYLQDRPSLLRHEAHHAGQWACWAGLPFLLGYGVAAGWSLLRTGSPALGNAFERRAGLVDGGYLPQP
jgi:hypothetical protein